MQAAPQAWRFLLALREASSAQKDGRRLRQRHEGKSNGAVDRRFRRRRALPALSIPAGSSRRRDELVRAATPPSARQECDSRRPAAVGLVSAAVIVEFEENPMPWKIPLPLVTRWPPRLRPASRHARSRQLASRAAAKMLGFAGFGGGFLYRSRIRAYRSSYDGRALHATARYDIRPRLGFIYAEWHHATADFRSGTPAMGKSASPARFSTVDMSAAEYRRASAIADAPAAAEHIRDQWKRGRRCRVAAGAAGAGGLVWRHH